jgi:hypothetical protein
VSKLTGLGTENQVKIADKAPQPPKYLATLCSKIRGLKCSIIFCFRYLRSEIFDLEHTLALVIVVYVIVGK